MKLNFWPFKKWNNKKDHLAPEIRKIQDAKNKELDKKIHELKKQGQKDANLEIATETMKILLQEASPILGYVLHNTPGAENYFQVEFRDDENPEMSFNLILQKRGKALPNQYQICGGFDSEGEISDV